MSLSLSPFLSNPDLFPYLCERGCGKRLKTDKLMQRHSVRNCPIKLICPTCSTPFSSTCKFNSHVRRHTAQPFDVDVPPRTALQGPLIGADATAAAPPPAGAAGDGQGPERTTESPNVIVTDMELPTFDFQLRLPEFDFEGF